MKGTECQAMWAAVGMGLEYPLPNQRGFWDPGAGGKRNGMCHSVWGGARAFPGSWMLQVEARGGRARNCASGRGRLRLGWPGSWKQKTPQGGRDGPPLPGHLHPFLLTARRGCLLPSNPGLYSMHNHCKGTPRPGRRGEGLGHLQ